MRDCDDPKQPASKGDPRPTSYTAMENMMAKVRGIEERAHGARAMLQYTPDQESYLVGAVGTVGIGGTMTTGTSHPAAMSFTASELV